MAEGLPGNAAHSTSTGSERSLSPASLMAVTWKRYEVPVESPTDSKLRSAPLYTR